MEAFCEPLPDECDEFLDLFLEASG